MKAFLLLLILMFASLLSANIKNPISKVYIADKEGTAIAYLPSGECKDIEKRQTYNASGLIFQTKEKSSQSFVLSNNSGIYMGEDTCLEIIKFVQEPFKLTELNLDMESSRSHVRGFIRYGYIAICYPKIVFGSSTTLETKLCRIRILMNSKLTIRALPERTEVILVDGKVGIQINARSFGTVNVGEKVLVNGTDVVIQKVDQKEFNDAVKKVTIACSAKKVVCFEIKDADGKGMGEMIMLPLIPIKLPTEYTTSPARLPE